MQIQSKIPAFDDVSLGLIQADTQTTASEIHGVLCGLVCVGPRLSGKFWLDTLVKRLESFDKTAINQQNLILTIYDSVCRQLNGLGSEFFLMLPADTCPLTERAEALSEWCQGFLYGLSLVGNPMEYASEDAHKAMRCITEIAKLNFENIVIDEMDKTAYQNISDYVESAVVMIYEELMNHSSEDATDTESSKQPHYLH